LQPVEGLMTTIPSNSSDQALRDIVSGANLKTIADVIATMKAIDALLPEQDGLKWFNHLYLMVTDNVNARPPEGAWQNPAWLDRLDVVFAGFYFDTLADSLAGREIAASWRAMLAARFTPGIDRIQFALAGMNAHINHDLALALLKTDGDLGVVPAQDGPEYRDYESVNGILNDLIPSVLKMLATDALGYIAQDTGKIGRILAYWNICRARDLAWEFANHLRNLRGIAYDSALEMQDALSGALGRAILSQL
jgi:Family of unknown function (DUF5995)